MNLEQYQTITGTTVASADQTRFTAEIARARRRLENALGYTLDPAQRETNLYNELGKTSTELACPIVNTEDLLDPDEVQGAYRLFNFNPMDEYHHVDPFTRIYAVKVVYIKQGASPNGITVKTFDDEYIRQHQNEIWSKYISDFRGHWPRTRFNLSWMCDHPVEHYYQLAVDADWAFEDIPEDLQDIWADMVTYYSDDERDKRSETILTHSWTKFDRGTPEALPDNQKLLYKYAGPHGALSGQVVL